MMKSLSTRISEQGVDVVGTDFGTFAAVLAFIRRKHDLIGTTYPLWIGAPGAENIAAFQKNQRANAFPIMERVFLNIKYSAGDVLC
ncbi:hypothetical protein PPNK14_24200 [Pectobacterium parmentieri]